MNSTKTGFVKGIAQRINNGLAGELRVFRQLFKLMKPYPLNVVAIVLLGLAASLAEGFGLSLFVPFLESLSISGSPANTGFPAVLNGLFASFPEGSRVVVIPLCIFGAIVLKNVLLLSNLALFAKLNAKISHQLRSRTFQQQLAVSDSFLSRQDPGELLSTLASETWRTSDALQRMVQLIITSCTVIVFITLMLLLSWPLTLVVAIAMMSISAIARLLTWRIKGLGQQAVTINRQLAVRMCEGLAGMRTIRSFGRERYEQARFDKTSQQVSQVFLKLSLLGFLVNPTYEVLGALLLLSVLGVTLSQGWIGLPTLLIFVLILYQLQPRVKTLGNEYVGLVGLISSIETVLSFLDSSDKPYISSGYRTFAGLQKMVEFDCVSFRYDKAGSLALDNVSLSIPQGKTTALVGPSGAGKSTLINLLFRFYDPIDGTLRVDGRPIRELNLADWRSQIALVSQDIYLFSGSVYDNIAYGRLEATEADIFAAARQANADTFIRELPDGYDTLVGDRGTNLSGGQRQRIALARAIVRDPDILILDEATNALDTLSESLIQEALERFSKGRTVIAIAHRLSTIEKADQIVVMQSGQIVDRGTLRQLLAREGLFCELYRLQYRHALSNH